MSRKGNSKRKTAPSCITAGNDSVKVTPKEEPVPGETNEFSHCSLLRKKNEFNISTKLKTPPPVQGKWKMRKTGRRWMDQKPNTARWQTKGRKRMKPLKLSLDPFSKYSLA